MVKINKYLITKVFIFAFVILMSFSSSAGEWKQGEYGIGWYYYENGQKLHDTLKEIDGKTYYFSSSGLLATDTTKEINGEYYIFNKNGELTKKTRFDPVTTRYMIICSVVFALFLIYTIIWYYVHPRQASSLATLAGAAATTMVIQKGVDDFLEKDRLKSNELSNKALDSLNSVNSSLGGNTESQNNKGLLS